MHCRTQRAYFHEKGLSFRAAVPSISAYFTRKLGFPAPIPQRFEKAKFKHVSPSSVISVSTTRKQRKNDGKWQYLGHLRKSFGTSTKHLWCNLLTFASSFQPLSRRNSVYFPSKNSRGDVETG